MSPAKSFACLVFPCPNACPGPAVLNTLLAQCEMAGFDLMVRHGGASLHLTVGAATGADAMLVRLICAALPPGSEAIVFWKDAKMGLPAANFRSHFADCLPQPRVSPRRVTPKTRVRPTPTPPPPDTRTDDLRHILTQVCSTATVQKQRGVSPWAAGVAAGLAGLSVALEDGEILVRFLTP